MKVKDIRTVNQNPSILLYGGLGTGKTAFMTQSGEKGLYLDFDDGIRTAVTLVDQWSSSRGELEVEFFYEPVTTKIIGLNAHPTKFLEARTFVVNEHNQIIKKTKPPKRIYVLDSFTGLVQSIQAMIKYNSKNPERNPSIEEWGLIINEIFNFMSLFKSLPAITIVNAHDQSIEDADGSIRWKLLCPGRKLPTQIVGLFDEVLYARIKKAPGGKKIFTISPDSSSAIEARTRSAFRGDWNMDDGLVKFLQTLGYEI